MSICEQNFCSQETSQSKCLTTFEATLGTTPSRHLHTCGSARRNFQTSPRRALSAQWQGQPAGQPGPTRHRPPGAQHPAEHHAPRAGNASAGTRIRGIPGALCPPAKHRRDRQFGDGALARGARGGSLVALKPAGKYLIDLGRTMLYVFGLEKV